MNAKRIEEETDLREEVSIFTPFGKLVTKSNGIIAVLILCVCVATLYFVLRTSESVADQRNTTASRYNDLIKSMRDQVQAQNLMTCIISLDQSRREHEYTQTNSFCRRMSGYGQ